MESISKQLQEEFIEKYGKIGEVIAKSKKFRNRRYYLHAKLKSIATINPRKKQLTLTKDTEDNPYLTELLVEFGYNIQYRIQ